MKLWFNAYNELAGVRLFGLLTPFGAKIQIIVNRILKSLLKLFYCFTLKCNYIS